MVSWTATPAGPRWTHDRDRARSYYGGWELVAGAPRRRGGRGDPHHGVDGRRGNMVWPGVGGEEW
jgi:hypothetical protein